MYKFTFLPFYQVLKVLLAQHKSKLLLMAIYNSSKESIKLLYGDFTIINVRASTLSHISKSTSISIEDFGQTFRIGDEWYYEANAEGIRDNTIEHAISVPQNTVVGSNKKM